MTNNRLTGQQWLAAKIAAGVSQQDLAAKLGVSQPTISRWATGASRPKKSLQVRLAEELGVPIGAWRGPWDYPPAKSGGYCHHDLGGWCSTNQSTDYKYTNNVEGKDGNT